MLTLLKQRRTKQYIYATKFNQEFFEGMGGHCSTSECTLAFALLMERHDAGLPPYTLEEFRTMDKNRLEGVSDHIRSLDCYESVVRSDDPVMRGIFTLFGAFLRNFDKVHQVPLEIPEGTFKSYFRYILPYFQLGVSREEIQQASKLMKLHNDIINKQGTTYNLLITYQQYQALKGDSSVFKKVYHIKSSIDADIQQTPEIYNKLLAMDVASEAKKQKKRSPQNHTVDDPEQIPIASHLLDSFNHPDIPQFTREGLMTDCFKVTVNKALDIVQQRVVTNDDDDNGASAAVP